MKIMTITISLLLCWVAYDHNLFRRRNEQSTFTSIEALESETERQEKRQHQNKLDLIPQWHRGARKPLRLRVNYFKTKPRDVRFSNQRKIRRMFSNL